MQTNLPLEWADGTYDFKLPWAACAEIERKGDAGIQSIYERVMIGSAHLADVVEIIRQGLLGGSGGTVDEQPVETTPAVVNKLLQRYVTGPDAPPFAQSWNVAKAIIHTFMVGYEPPEGDGVKKNEEAAAVEPARIDLGQLLANCAMMAIPPSEARQLTLYEYQALLDGWNRAHSKEGEEELAPPSLEDTMARREALERQGIKVLH